MIKEVPMSPHDLFIDLGSGKQNIVITSIQLFFIMSRYTIILF